VTTGLRPSGAFTTTFDDGSLSQLVLGLPVVDFGGAHRAAANRLELAQMPVAERAGGIT
jgi:hypothetical protein